jgi:hypothetical protein
MFERRILNRRVVALNILGRYAIKTGTINIGTF